MFRRSFLRCVVAAAEVTATTSRCQFSHHPPQSLDEAGLSVKLTQRCSDQIQKVNQQQESKTEASLLRLKITTGGCHGFAYQFSFDKDVQQSKDFVLQLMEDGETKVMHNPNLFLKLTSEAEAVTSEGNNGGKESSTTTCSTEGNAEKTAVVPQMLIDAKSAKKLQGAVIDYHTELKGSAFVVIGNELVDHECACGQSFSVKKRPLAKMTKT